MEMNYENNRPISDEVIGNIEEVIKSIKEIEEYLRKLKLY
jgi:hypothetical protein